MALTEFKLTFLYTKPKSKSKNKNKNKNRKQKNHTQETYENKFGLITADLPYGTQQQDHVRDPVLSDSQCDTVAAGVHKAAADQCVAVLGCGTAEQVAQWKKAMTGAGWRQEPDARVIINTKSHVRQKTGYHTRNRKKNTISTIANCHYWLVCYKGYDNGVFPWDQRFAFGFMDTAMSGLKSTVLTENPSIPPHYRLVDKFGSPLNPYEKHLGEIVEQLTRFTDRNAMVLDFCSGTGSAALACLYLNQRFIVCNDRDKDQTEHAETRAKAYLSAMMQSNMWESWGSNMANPTITLAARSTRDGTDKTPTFHYWLRLQRRSMGARQFVSPTTSRGVRP